MGKIEIENVKDWFTPQEAIKYLFGNNDTNNLHDLSREMCVFIQRGQLIPFARCTHILFDDVLLSHFFEHTADYRNALPLLCPQPKYYQGIFDNDGEYTSDEMQEILDDHGIAYRDEYCIGVCGKNRHDFYKVWLALDAKDHATLDNILKDKVPYYECKSFANILSVSGMSIGFPHFELDRFIKAHASPSEAEQNTGLTQLSPAERSKSMRREFEEEKMLNKKGAAIRVAKRHGITKSRFYQIINKDKEPKPDKTVPSPWSFMPNKK